ncbi:MAG: hypothetical protein K0R51_2654 [Cytophagaceae bacterium]|nr:hypothetical protein [Cytophagaceae bacterium]
MKDIFQNIEAKYKDLNHQLGWRFLTTYSETLKKNSGIALLTLNPGGDEAHKSSILCTPENQNSYLHEDWRGKGNGNDPLQVQVQHLFKELTKHHPKYKKVDQLMIESLMGYFIPFRSPDIKRLIAPEASRKFAVELWSSLLITANLSLVICIDHQTFRDVKSIYLGYGFKLQDEQVYETGWGKIKAESVKASKDTQVLVIVRLPHLSRFKIFGRPGKEKFMDTMIRGIASDALQTKKFV